MAECKETGCTNFNGGADKCAIRDSKDQQIADLKTQVAELEAEVERQKKIVVRSSNRNFEKQAEIANKDRVIEVLAERTVAYTGSCPHDSEHPWEWACGCDVKCDEMTDKQHLCWKEWAEAKAKE